MRYLLRDFAILLVCTLIVVTLFATLARAEIIKFVWDKPTANADGSTPVTVSGYRFYISPVPGTYGPSNAGIPASSTTYSFVVPEKMAGGSYYATVTAYNAQGESERSNEIQFTTKPKPANASGLRLVQ